jgi:hypothetical protein
MPSKVIKYKSPRKHYQADACIVWCFDDRFSGTLENFVRLRKFRNFDLIKIGGGAKALTGGSGKFTQKFVLDQIKTSLRLHHPPLVILMTHSDCGAYGGLAAFDNDPRLERKKHRAFLVEARKILRRNLPRSVKIETVFADFEKLSRE